MGSVSFPLFWIDVVLIFDVVCAVLGTAVPPSYCSTVVVWLWAVL